MVIAMQKREVIASYAEVQGNAEGQAWRVRAARLAFQPLHELTTFHGNR